MEKSELAVFPLQLRRLLVVFLITGSVIVLTNLGVSFFMPVVPLTFLNSIDLNEEYNLASYFSGALLCLAAAFCCVRGWISRKISTPIRFWPYWLLLMLVFNYLAFDEVFLIHEMLEQHWDWSGYSSYLTNAWVIPALLLVSLFLLIMLRFLYWLPDTERQNLILSGSLFIAGAVGVEVVAGHYWYTFGNVRDMTYQLLNTLEEGLEISAVLYFCHILATSINSTVMHSDAKVKRRQMSKSFGIGLLLIATISLATVGSTPLLRNIDPWATKNLLEAETMQPRTTESRSELNLVRIRPGESSEEFSRGSLLLLKSDEIDSTIEFTLAPNKPGRHKNERCSTQLPYIWCHTIFD